MVPFQGQLVVQGRDGNTVFLRVTGFAREDRTRHAQTGDVRLEVVAVVVEDADRRIPGQH